MYALMLNKECPLAEEITRIILGNFKPVLVTFMFSVEDDTAEAT